MDKPLESNSSIIPKGQQQSKTELEKLKQRETNDFLVSLGKAVNSSVGGSDQQKCSQCVVAGPEGVEAKSELLTGKQLNSTPNDSIKVNALARDCLVWERAETLQNSQASSRVPGFSFDYPSQERKESVGTELLTRTANVIKGSSQLSLKQTINSDSSKNSFHGLEEKDFSKLSRKIEELSNEVTYENYLEVPTSLISEISELWRDETLYVLGRLLDIFHSKRRWQCVVVILVLLKNISLSTDDLKSNKEVARKVYSLSRLSTSDSVEEGSWYLYIVRLSKAIVTMWKKTVIEASKRDDEDLKVQTAKRSRTGNMESVNKKQKLVSKGLENQMESDLLKSQTVTLSDDALFGTSLPNVTISKRSTSSSKLSRLTAPLAGPGKTKNTEESPQTMSSNDLNNADTMQQVSELSLKSETVTKSAASKKKVQFAPPEKLVTIHEIENIDQLRQWEREDAGLSSVDLSSQGSSGPQWNETFEAHKKREREMEKSLFQTKSENFVKAVREMREEMEWRNPSLILVEHAVIPGLESVEKTSRERVVQLVPERYSDRNYHSPASPEHKSIELSPLQEIPLESIETSSQASQQLSIHSNMTFKENQAVSQQHSVNSFPSQSQFDNNSNVLQMLQQNPSVLQSLLSAFGASMSGNSTLTGTMQTTQSVNYGQQNNNGNDSAVQGLPSTSVTYSGTNLFSSGLSMVNILPSSQSNIEPMLLQQLSQQNQRAVMNQQAFQGPGAPFFSYAQQNKSSFAPSSSDAFNHPNAGNVAIGSINSYGSSQSILNRSVDDKKTNASKKGNICYFYNQGTCANGDSCRFLHVKVPYKVPHPKSTKK